ncbi:hypothetical protein [Streptomyces sp. NPDC001020]
MSAATVSAVPGRPGPPSGATALGQAHRRHRLGDVLRAVRVFAGAAFDVLLFGEYCEEMGVRRHR